SKNLRLVAVTRRLPDVLAPSHAALLNPRRSHREHDGVARLPGRPARRDREVDDRAGERRAHGAGAERPAHAAGHIERGAARKRNRDRFEYAAGRADQVRDPARTRAAVGRLQRVPFQQEAVQPGHQVGNVRGGSDLEAHRIPLPSALFTALRLFSSVRTMTRDHCGLASGCLSTSCGSSPMVRSARPVPPPAPPTSTSPPSANPRTPRRRSTSEPSAFSSWRKSSTPGWRTTAARTTNSWSLKRAGMLSLVPVPGPRISPPPAALTTPPWENKPKPPKAPSNFWIARFASICAAIWRRLSTTESASWRMASPKLSAFSMPCVKKFCRLLVRDCSTAALNCAICCAARLLLTASASMDCANSRA